MYIRIEGVGDVPYIKANYKIQVRQTGEFQVTIPAQIVRAVELRYRNVSLYWNDGVFVSGFITRVVSSELAKNEPFTYTLTCMDELARLAMYGRADSNAYYENRTATYIIGQLLHYARRQGLPWYITDVSSMAEPDGLYTVDLRNKETIWAQIVELANVIPDFNVRFGGYNESLDLYELHAGAFNQVTSQLIQGDNLTRLKGQPNTKDIIRIIEPVSGGNNPLTLNTPPSIPLTSGYPISTDSNGRAIVTRTATPAGGAVLKKFSNIQTRTDSPTPTEIQNTVNSLYLRAVAFLDEHQFYLSYTGEAELPAPPRLADLARVRSTVEEPIYDPFTERVTRYLPTFLVDENFFILGYSVDIEAPTIEFIPFTERTRPLLGYSIELSNLSYLENTDPTLDVFKELDTPPQSAISSSDPGLKGTTDVVIALGPLLAPDCGTGKLFTFPLPAVPMGASHVICTFRMPSGNHARIVQMASVGPNADLILCVNEGRWTSTSSMSITARFEFY